MIRTLTVLSAVFLLAGLAAGCGQHKNCLTNSMQGSCMRAPENCQNCTDPCQDCCPNGCKDPGCRDPKCPRHCGKDPAAGQPLTGAVTYPYYTTRGPRDYLNPLPPSIGP